MATATEEVVTTEQEAWEAGQAETEPAEEAKDGELFDRDAYQRPELRIDTVDGEEVDKIWVKVTGRIPLDRRKPEDVALFNRIRLGKEVELRVAGKGARVGTGYTTSKGGDLEAVVGEREIRVDTIYVLDPEEL